MDLSLAVPTNSGPLDVLHAAVTAAGGNWVGVQTTLDGIDAENFATLQFMNPLTGRLLSWSFRADSFFTYESVVKAVGAEIEKDNASFADRKISVKASTLQRLTKTAFEVAKELEELTREKKCQKSTQS